MKKFINDKKLFKIAKGALVVVLAGSFTFSASNAFADENVSQTQPVTAETDTSATSSTTIASEAPSLLPGDFFYFTKLAVEKIKLALTFDDVKEAQLLASFASERLAEAKELFAEGKQKEAIDALQTAMVDMNNSDKIVTDQTAPAVPTDNSKEAEDVTNSTDQESNDQTKTTNTEVETDETEKVDQVNSILSKNIAALTVAMEKVKNPTAKAALQRNIDKSYSKLAARIKKHEEKVAKMQKKIAERNAETKMEDTDKNTVEAVSDVKTETEVHPVVTEDKSTTDVNLAVSKSNTAKAPVLANENVQTKTVVDSESKPAPSVTKQVKQEVSQVVPKQPIRQRSEAVNEQVKQTQTEARSFVGEKIEAAKEKNHKDSNR